MSKKLILCDCGGSQPLDPAALEQSGFSCSKVHSALCTREISAAGDAIAAGDATIACQQERQRFEDLAAELEMPAPDFVDLRDRAGWSDDTRGKSPKMVALAADALISRHQTKTVDVMSQGVCLVIAASEETGLAAARDLSDALSVTLVLTGESEAAIDSRFDLLRGSVRQVSGALGGFSVRIDRLQLVDPVGRGALNWTAPRDGAFSECDIIVDLTGDAPLVPAPEKREGYLRADPGSVTAVSKTLLTAVKLVGTFEKPLYLETNPLICAHSRAEKTGCTRCLDVCPTSALVPDGDHVTVDPMVCAGCGACSSVCPSGAVAYDMPPAAEIFQRMDTLARSYRKAGGDEAVLLVHDPVHDGEMISLCARFGAGLPANVIPLDMSAPSGFGHAEMLAALACGFRHVAILPSLGTDLQVLAAQQTLAAAIAGPDRITVLNAEEPDALADELRSLPSGQPGASPVLPLGSRRQVTRLAAQAFHPDTDECLPLPDDAPYGAVLVDTDACTLCLSCVSLCPSGALADNPDMPQLRFQEDACLQCGICANICPENAITLEPRLNLADEALRQVVLHEEEPFACVECGALFGVKSTVERIVEKLSGVHSMYQNPKAVRMIQMCDNCRVTAQYNSENDPFAAGDRPMVRTTDDYTGGRRDH